MKRANEAECKLALQEQQLAEAEKVVYATEFTVKEIVKHVDQTFAPSLKKLVTKIANYKKKTKGRRN